MTLLVSVDAERVEARGPNEGFPQLGRRGRVFFSLTFNRSPSSGFHRTSPGCTLPVILPQYSSQYVPISSFLFFWR